MAERLAIIVLVAVMVTAAVLVIRRWNARRVIELIAQAPLWDALGESPDGRRTLVAFSTPSCAACHTAQAPAIKAVEQQLGAAEIRVIKVDASKQPEVARAFGVLTVPSTVVLEPAGRVVAINQGFAPSRRLIEQLEGA
ncbi:MAG: thioredoxin family protein [Chloroflexi bacterium]|nr:MAG: thioredoxin family protein [Chloroflexota bacterium]